MKKLIILTMILLFSFSIAFAKEKDDSVSISDFMDGYDTYDVAIQAYCPRIGDIVFMSLIDESMDFGLEGEGKEDAKLIVETMRNLELQSVNKNSETFFEGKWHFTITLFMNQNERKVSISLYDYNRASKFTVTDGNNVIHEQWGKISLKDIRIFEDMYLKKVCALFPSAWED